MRSQTEPWNNLGARLNIAVVSPARVGLPSGPVTFTALLPQFGAPAGMVIDVDGDHLWAHRSALTELGYGFSTVELDETAEVESTKQMLRDWGWMASEPVPGWW